MDISGIDYLGKDYYEKAILIFDMLILDWEGGKPKDMCEVLDRVEKRGEEKGRKDGVDQTRLESIKNVMEGLKYTAQQAMDLLKIPLSEQPKYAAKL